MSAPAASPTSVDKPFDNLVLSNLSSPRFDISDFLKTPTDGSPKEKEEEEEEKDALFSSFQGFTLPSTLFMSGASTTNPMSTIVPITSLAQHHLNAPPLPDHISAAPDVAAPLAHAEPDFGASLLFEDCKKGNLNIDHALNHGNLIPFDDYIDGVLDGGDSFSIFNDVHYDTTVSSNASTSLGYVPYVSADHGLMLSSLSAPPTSLYGLPKPYLGSEARGLVEVGEHVMISVDHRASTSGEPNALLYQNSQTDWGVANYSSAFPPIGQQGSLQCEGCQLLRRIIHSNGVYIITHCHLSSDGSLNVGMLAACPFSRIQAL